MHEKIFLQYFSSSTLCREKGKKLQRMHLKKIWNVLNVTSFDWKNGSAPAMQSSKNSSSDILSQPFICKKFLTVSLLSSHPFPSCSLFFFRQGKAGPRGWKGKVCRIRLCGIRYNPFCLILCRSEKPCQACMAAIEDLLSQYSMLGEIWPPG